MKVLGVDPAPRFGGHVFDGHYRRVRTTRLAVELCGLRNTQPSLLCWDAPLTGPPEPTETSDRNGVFTKRPVEAFFTQQRWRFRVPDGISVLGYAGCQHWTISRHLLGLPRVGPWDTGWSDLPFELLTDGPPTGLGNYVVEVHPALALWLWCGFGDDSWPGPWTYKRDTEVLARLWCRLCDRVEAFAPDLLETITAPGQPRNDDDFDCRIAWLLGRAWIDNTGEVGILGSRQQGAFLVPEVSGMRRAFEEFSQRDGV